MEGFQPSATAPTSGSLNGYAVSESLPSLSVVETTISTTALSQATSNNFAPVTLVSSRHSSDPELNYALPTSNSNLPLSSAVPSSMSSNPGGLCVVNSGNSTTRENNLMPEMEYFFNLMYQIPFPPSTDLPSQQPILVEERERVDTVQQLPASTPLSAASESLPTISTVEPSSTTTTTALSQPPRNCTPASLFSSELTSGSFGAASESLSIVEPSSTTTTTTAFSQPSSSNFAPVSFVSSRHSSDPELNDALHTLLSDGGNMCSGEDTVVSDEIPPYLFGLPTFLLPVVPRPSSADVLSHMQGPIVVEGRTDTLQHSMSSNLDGLHVLPTSNSNLSLSRNTSAVPSSVSSNPGGLCAVNSGNTTTRENNLTPEMKYFFDLLYQIPLPPSAGLPSQEVSQPTLVEERERVDTLQRLPSSTSLSAATESLPTMSTLESSCTTTTTALSQPPSSNISPVSLESSRHSLNNALNILFSDGDNKCGGEGTVVLVSDECLLICLTYLLSSFLSPLLLFHLFLSLLSLLLSLLIPLPPSPYFSSPYSSSSLPYSSSPYSSPSLYKPVAARPNQYFSFSCMLLYLPLSYISNFYFLLRVQFIPFFLPNYALYPI